MRTITRRGRRAGEERLGVHEKADGRGRCRVKFGLIMWHNYRLLQLVQHTFDLLYHHQTRTRTIATRVSMLSAISNEPATFSILRFDK